MWWKKKEKKKENGSRQDTYATVYIAPFKLGKTTANVKKKDLLKINTFCERFVRFKKSEFEDEPHSGRSQELATDGM